MSSKYEDLEHLAARIMTQGIKETELLEHYEYKKGKTFDDVKSMI